MKTLFTILFSILFLTSFGQIKRFLIQGQIVDQTIIRLAMFTL